MATSANSSTAGGSGDAGDAKQQQQVPQETDQMLGGKRYVPPPATAESERMKAGALLVLVVQNAALALVMRYSALQAPDGKRYLASTAVLMAEVLKFFGSWGLCLMDRGETMASVYARVTATSPKEFASLCVPAFLYLVQNNLAFVATQNLDAAPYQLLYQLKIFTTAVLSVALLGKKLTSQHWAALVMLFVGVVMVQFSTMEESGSGKSSSAASAKHAQDPIKGFIAILVAVFLSGLSGVWFERILKGSNTSVWVRNVQMAAISGVLGLFQVYVQDGDRVARDGFFSGYNRVVWLVIALQGGGGMVVALVVKYADNILKGFATSLSIVLSVVVSVMWLGFHASALFLAGAAVVLVAAFAYGQADTNKPSAPPASNAGASNSSASSGGGDASSRV